MYINDDNRTYSDSFRVEYIRKEFKQFIGNKNVKRVKGNKNVVINIYRIQAYDSIMWGYLCIGFIDFIIKGKSIQIEYTSLEFIFS